MRRFENRVALVTGAASGIGRASVLRLAEEGARVLCADVQAEALEATVKAVEERGSEALACLCDVSDRAQVDAAVGAALEHFGALHVLCNIAGILRFEHTHEVALEDWNRILAVNLTGTFHTCQAALPHLLATRGAIVNTASTAALAGAAWTAAYSASKGGVLSFTRTLAIEYGKQGLRANAVCPGSIQTPMHQAFRIPEGADPKLVYRMMPLDEHRGPETVASTVAFLASDDAAHVNGVALRVDGAALS